MIIEIISFFVIKALLLSNPPRKFEFRTKSHLIFLQVTSQAEARLREADVQRNGPWVSRHHKTSREIFSLHLAMVGPKGMPPLNTPIWHIGEKGPQPEVNLSVGNINERLNISPNRNTASAWWKCCYKPLNYFSNVYNWSHNCQYADIIILKVLNMRSRLKQQF